MLETLKGPLALIKIFILCILQKFRKDEDPKQFKIPQKLKDLLYTDFSLVSETSTYKVFEAKTRDTKEKHHIRVLDATKGLVKDDYDISATLFVQELLHLQQNQPGSVLTHTFEINDHGKLIGCATLPSIEIPVSTLLKESKQARSKRYLILFDDILSIKFS